MKLMLMRVELQEPSKYIIPKLLNIKYYMFLLLMLKKMICLKK